MPDHLVTQYNGMLGWLHPPARFQIQVSAIQYPIVGHNTIGNWITILFCWWFLNSTLNVFHLSSEQQIRNHSFHQRIQDLDLISLAQRRLRGQLIAVLKHLNGFTTARPKGHFDYVLNERTRNNWAKLLIKHFNTSVAQHIY